MGAFFSRSIATPPFSSFSPCFQCPEHFFRNRTHFPENRGFCSSGILHPPSASKDDIRKDPSLNSSFDREAYLPHATMERFKTLLFFHSQLHMDIFQQTLICMEEKSESQLLPCFQIDASLFV